VREWIRRLLARPVGVLIGSLSAAVLGVISYANIPLQMLPDGFEEREIRVTAELRESSPEEAERFVAIPIEESLGTVGGIESIATRCGRGGVEITVELKRDADPAAVEGDVRDRVARAGADMPDDVERLRVRREGQGDRPIVFFACTADCDRVDLSDWVERRILPRLESVEGVARAQAWGLLKRTVRVYLDPEEVARRNLDLRDLLARLRGDNLSADLGDIGSGERKAFLRADMPFTSLDEIRSFPVIEGVRLSDIARVEIVPSLDQGWSRYNGNAVIVGTLYKRSGANTVETCRRVRESFDGLTGEKGIKDLELIPFFDQGKMIENSLRTLYENALYGGLLAVGILYAFFRRLRMTLLVAAAIPLSLTMAVTLLYLAGDSLNIGTLMGLTLAVGMLIDNAIVVVEAIFKRREKGELPAEAASKGTGEVSLAVITATLTTIVVFLPAIVLSSGNDAKIWLSAIGLPIAYSLLASILVALVLVPLGSVYLRRDRRSRRPAPGPRQVAGGHSAALRPPGPPRIPGSHDGPTRYERLLGFALRRRFAVVLLAMLAIGSVAFPFSRLGQKGAMGHGGGPVRVMVRWPRHYVMADCNAAMQQYEEYVLGAREGLELEGIYTRFDRYSGMAMMWRHATATRKREEIEEEVKKHWPRIPGVWTSLETAGAQGTTKITLEGEDPRALEQTMEAIEARLKLLPTVRETQRPREEGMQELRVSADPEAVARGQIAPEMIRGMIGWVLRGARMRDFRMDGQDLPVLIEFDPDQEVMVSDLPALRIPTETGIKPLGTLATLDIRSAPTTIERRDGRRVAEMEVLGGGEDDEAFHGEVQAVLRATPLPPGVRTQVSGSWAKLQASFSELGDALKLGAALVFLLTAILFEALLLPLAVICAIFPAIAGAVWGLYLAGKPMDELSWLGAILLVGIVVNNGIVLIDCVQQRRRDGLPLKAAVRVAGRDRIRPVLMTALTTIVGLVPMAIFKGGNDEIHYDTIATAVIGGLVASTVVTLLLVPVVFTLFHALGEHLRSILRRALART